MTGLHILRTTHDVWIAQIQHTGCRLWETVGRHRTQAGACRRAVSACLMRDAKRFRVLAAERRPSYYEPMVVLEGRRR